MDASVPDGPATAEHSPYVTYALLTVLIGVFFVEVTNGIGFPTGMLEPTIATLIAMGGLHRQFVDQGEWYRLISATFLHGSALHLLMNGIVLFWAGRLLERTIGHAWFAAIYAISGLGGSLMSLAVNTDGVSIGASGALMGVVAACLVCSFRFPAGELRQRLQSVAWQVLIPSLLPLASTAKGMKVDYGAHIGGAIGGAVAALAMLPLWQPKEAVPRLRGVAAAMACIWFVAAAAAPVFIVPTFITAKHEADLRAQLIPENQIPKGRAAEIANSDRLTIGYPHDPRSHLYSAYKFEAQGDWQQTASALRAALAQEDMLKTLWPAAFEDSLRNWLVDILQQHGQQSEAREVAKPSCAHVKQTTDAALAQLRRACG